MAAREVTGAHAPGTSEWQAEQDIIHEITHEAATSIQKHVRGRQARDGATPPMEVAAQASAEISAEMDEGIHGESLAVGTAQMQNSKDSLSYHSGNTTSSKYGAASNSSSSSAPAPKRKRVFLCLRKIFRNG